MEQRVSLTVIGGRITGRSYEVLRSIYGHNGPPLSVCVSSSRKDLFTRELRFLEKDIPSRTGVER